MRRSVVAVLSLLTLVLATVGVETSAVAQTPPQADPDERLDVYAGELALADVEKIVERPGPVPGPR